MATLNLKPFLLTGTDTGVGKTHFALRLLSYCGKGSGFRVLKPIACGVNEFDNVTCNPDVKALADAQSLTVGDVNFVTYLSPMAPQCAAMLEGRFAGFDDIVAWCKMRVGGNFCVEGVGGLLVPIDGNNTVLDLALALQLPLVVAARCGLGTINHTLLTVNAAITAGLSVSAVIMSQENPVRDAVDDGAIAYITARLAPIPVYLLPNCGAVDTICDCERVLFSHFVSLMTTPNTSNF